jgi:hypothetical protein
MSLFNKKSPEYKELKDIMIYDNKGFEAMNEILNKKRFSQKKLFEIKEEMRNVFSEKKIQQITKRYLLKKYRDKIYKISNPSEINLKTLKKIGFSMGMVSPLHIIRNKNEFYVDGKHIISKRLNRRDELIFWYNEFLKISPNYK